MKPSIVGLLPYCLLGRSSVNVASLVNMQLKEVGHKRWCSIILFTNPGLFDQNKVDLKCFIIRLTLTIYKIPTQACKAVV